MNWIKRMIRKFTSRPKLTEEYIINITYQHIKPVVEFLEKRKQWCEKEGKESVRISGEFIINAKSVSLLIAALEGKNIHIMSGYPFFDGFILGEEGAKEIANRLEAQKKRCDELEGKLSKTDDERYEAKRERDLLKDKINEFNETRRPWERKLNIEK